MNKILNKVGVVSVLSVPSFAFAAVDVTARMPVFGLLRAGN